MWGPQMMTKLENTGNDLSVQTTNVLAAHKKALKGPQTARAEAIASSLSSYSQVMLLIFETKENRTKFLVFF